MMKHFVLNLNPAAQFEWERCALHHPITAEQPDFAELIATSVRESVQNPDRSSSYLIAVKLEVVVLESSVAESMADQVSEMMPNTVPDTVPKNFPNSIAIPLLESGRSVRNSPERLAGVA
jgi:hypothetical protein